MWNSALELDKYRYVQTNPYSIRIIGLIGISATLLMGYGFFQYIFISPAYTIVFGPIVLIFIANKLLRFTVQLFYPKFDIQKHERFLKKFWSVYEEPSVDIFLPWAGEDLDMHEEVLKAIDHLDYKNLEVYMLDDVGSVEHKNLAKKYGYNYLSRPNKGEYKKSGNLQYGYRYSSGEFILILDADFIPVKDILHELVPYIVMDSKIGILQTPQYFEQTHDVHQRSKIEFGGGNIVEDFYKIIMPCRDEFKAAMCVGTSALYRRSTISKLDGTPKVDASEELATGLLVTHYGYYVKYLPLIVSMGKSPDTYQGYFKQHMRWCSGNLVFARFWSRAKLSLVARILYLVNPMHYFSEAFTVIFSFQFLVLLYFHSDSLLLLNTLYFMPYVILSRLVIPFTRVNKNRLGTRLAALSNSYTYFYTFYRMLTRRVPAWHPSGKKLTELHEDFLGAYDTGMVISSVFIISFLFVLINRPFLFENYNTYVVLGWGFYSAFWHSLFLTFVLQYIHPIKLTFVKSRVDKAFLYVKTHVILVLFFTLVGLSIVQFVVVTLLPITSVSGAIPQFQLGSN